MKLLLLLGLLATTQAFAKDYQFRCEATYNLQQAFVADIKVPEGKKDVLFATLGQFEFYLSSKPNNIVELQIYDAYEPSRTYASANMTSTHFVELAIWKRDFLIEVRCTQ